MAAASSVQREALEERICELEATVAQQREELASLRSRVGELDAPQTLAVRDGVEMVQKDQFVGHDAQRVVVPASVLEVCEGAFADWEELRTVEF